MEKNETNVMTGKKMVRCLMGVAVSLVAAITVCIAVLTVCSRVFSINDLDPVITGERIGIIIWLMGITFVMAKTIIKSKVTEG